MDKAKNAASPCEKQYSPVCHSPKALLLPGLNGIRNQILLLEISSGMAQKRAKDESRRRQDEPVWGLASLECSH